MSAAAVVELESYNALCKIKAIISIFSMAFIKISLKSFIKFFLRLHIQHVFYGII